MMQSIVTHCRISTAFKELKFQAGIATIKRPTNTLGNREIAIPGYRVGVKNN
jgi:hypothetical protein